MTASCTTRTPPTRADWTVCGACTSGSTARQRAATSLTSGGASTTSTTAERSPDGHGATLGSGDVAALRRARIPARVPRPLRAAPRGQRGGNRRVERLDVGDGRDVDGVDAAAGAAMAGRRGVVPRHVGRDDDGDDAAVPDPDAVAPSRGDGPDGRRRPSGPVGRAGRPRILLRVGGVRGRGLSAGSRVGGGRDEAGGAGRGGPAGGRAGGRGRRLLPAHRGEGAPPRVLPGGARTRRP